ncbi:hypothetical protein OK074_5240 [Actinobacteria bacterium OK074]|nr:hypothetical protein OK074_5240 [Actinobacteria bacterium OK074]
MERPRENTRSALPSFSGRIFSQISRIDQRGWAEAYLRGLLTTKGKKSLRNMAEQLGLPDAIQSFQQFINQSPWDWEPVCRNLASEVLEALNPELLVIDNVVIPKRGKCSVGVDRYFVPQLRKSVNGQIGMGLFLAAETASVPVAWHILLSDRWMNDCKLREKTYVPCQYGTKTAWQAALALLETVNESWGAPARPVAADFRGLRGAEQLIGGLLDRRLEFLLELDPSVRLLEAVPRRLPRAAPQGVPEPRCLTDLPVVREFRRRAGTRGAFATGGRPHPPVATTTVRLPGPGRAMDLRLLTEWPASARAGAPRFFLTNVTGWDTRGLVRARQIWHRHKKSRQVFQSDYGVDDFEGRSFLGWHHHMALASAAFTFNRLGTSTAHRELLGARQGPHEEH